MRRLNFYIAKTVLLSIGLVIGVILSIDLIFTFVAQFHAIGHNDYTMLDAIEFVFLRLPSDLYLILPVCAFIGVLAALGQLASKSELIAMRSAGVSVAQICHGVLYAALVVMLVGYLLAIYISPVTRHMAYAKRNQPSQRSAVLVLASATWVRVGDNIIYIGRTLPGGRLDNIISYRIQNNQISQIVHANTAQVTNTHWILSDVTMLDIAHDHITKRYHKQTTNLGLLSPNLLHILTLEPEDMTLWALYEYIQYRQQNQLDPKPYVLQIWLRILQPFTLIVMMLLAVPFVFGPLRSATMGLRLAVGLSVGFAFYIASQFFGSFTLISPLPAFLGASLPTVVFALVLLIMIRRIN